MTTYCLKDFENPATRDQAIEYFKKNPREYFLSPEVCRDDHNMRSMDDKYSKWVIKPSNVKRDTDIPYQFRNECQALELHDETEIQNIWNERLDKLDTECYKMLISKVTSDDFSFSGYTSTYSALKYLFIQVEEQQKRIDELENIISTLVHK